MCYVLERQVSNDSGVSCTVMKYIGSGKTLAYLIPLISRLKDEETNHGLIPRLKRPRALIVVPTRDLANQVLVSIYSCSI